MCLFLVNRVYPPSHDRKNHGKAGNQTLYRDVRLSREQGVSEVTLYGWKSPAAVWSA
jgi:hypothetical protein